MIRNIFLEKNRSVSSINRESKLPIGFSVKEKPIKDNSIDTDFSLFEEYLHERDSCDKYRMLFKINAICSNVLFNTQTEIVLNEGSDDAIRIMDDTSLSPLTINDGDNDIQNSEPISRKQAIRDTEYSHKKNGGFVYHCGLDIFNNHQLRNIGFTHVNNIKQTSNSESTLSRSVYNTISDFVRYGDGMIMKEDVNPRITNQTQQTKLHLYTIDTIRTMKAAYTNEIKEKNGWIGFYNKSNIDIKNNEQDNTRINCVLNNRKPCEYIDMYPDRTLYSFVPKYNDCRKRIEKNWDYCITYPYKKDYGIIDTICKGKAQAIKCSIKITTNTNGILVIECSSLFNHTLVENSKINVYYYKQEENDSLTYTKYDVSVNVYYVGDVNGENTNSVFAIRYEDIEPSALEDMINNGFFYKKVVDGEECEYYARKYKKLLGLDSNGNRTQELKSETGKVAFGNSIYGDSIAQIVFTDDIDVSGLFDHMGRPLSEVYLTVIKRNAGHTQWYYQNDPGNEAVEYSHCFGKITSGLNLHGDASINFDYNIRRLHNVNKNAHIYFGQYEHVYDVLGSGVTIGMPKVIEDDITILNDVFYGNIVEFDKSSYTEIELSPVYHRFNTEQREYNKDNTYAELFHDEIRFDDFDFSNGTSATFNVTEMDYAGFSMNGTNFKSFANLRPEGYFYNPHTRITIRKESEMPTSVKAKYVNFINVSGFFDSSENKTTVTMEVPSNYKFLKREHIAIYDRGDGVDGTGVYWGEISNVNNNVIDIAFNGCPFANVAHIPGEVVDISNILQTETDGIRRFYTFYSTYGVPTYAAFIKSNLSFVWKGLELLSENNYGDELYNMPYANGRNYIEKNINFFVRRQDENGLFGLLYSIGDYQNPIELFAIPGSEFDVSQAIDFYNNLNNVCY